MAAKGNSKCEVVIPMAEVKSRELKFDDAARIAMKKSQKDGRELAFFYDVRNDRVVSPVYEGGENCIAFGEMVESALRWVPERKDGDRVLGFFHTHWFGNCVPSMVDVDVNFEYANVLGEASVGCPNLGNEIHRYDLSSLEPGKRESLWKWRAWFNPMVDWREHAIIPVARKDKATNTTFYKL